MAAGFIISPKLLSNRMDKQTVPVAMEEKKAGDSKEDIQTQEKAFLLFMIPHHEEAVETSKFVLVQTKDLELRNFAQKVVEVQTTEIEQMKASYKTLFGEEYKADGKYEPMMSDLRSLSGLALEKSYVIGMTGHHEGAIAAAGKIAELGDTSTLSPLAKGIVEAQTSEVAVLNRWLTEKYQNVQIKDAAPAMRMMH